MAVLFSGNVMYHLTEAKAAENQEGVPLIACGGG
jgi:hypothetical protein